MSRITGNSGILSKIGLGGAIIIAPLFLSQTVLAAPKDAYLAPGGAGNCSSTSAACATFAEAINYVGKGGTIHVADGSYNQDITDTTKNQINIVADNPGSVNVTLDGPSSWGVYLEGVNDITISGINFNVSSDNSTVAYALHAHNARTLTLQDDKFTGPGKTSEFKTGGVDINSSYNVTETNVSASDFSKNGFSFTSQYNVGDEISSHVTLTNISATDNEWSGIAFYTTTNTGNSTGHSIHGVTFNGNNSITGSGGAAIYFEGTTDATAKEGGKPTFQITGLKDMKVKLGSISFVSNAFDIIKPESRINSHLVA